MWIHSHDYDVFILFADVQTLVSSILLRPHPQDPNATVLSNTSGIRQQVEITRMEIVRWMRKRWAGVQQEGGFDSLEGWALKELSHGGSCGY